MSTQFFRPMLAQNVKKKPRLLVGRSNTGQSEDVISCAASNQREWWASTSTFQAATLVKALNICPVGLRFHMTSCCCTLRVIFLNRRVAQYDVSVCVCVRLCVSALAFYLNLCDSVNTCQNWQKQRSRDWCLCFSSHRFPFTHMAWRN